MSSFRARRHPAREADAGARGRAVLPTARAAISARATSAVQWLIDTPERLAGVRALAERSASDAHQRRDRRRPPPRRRAGHRDARAASSRPSPPTRRLAFAGFMGYDPHVAKVPSWARSRASLIQEVRETLPRLRRLRARALPELWNERVTLNGAGSPTLPLYEDDTLLNDLSVGSALVKPTDFDLVTRWHRRRAGALHRDAGPEARRAPRSRARLALAILDWWNPNRPDFFLYGGYWMAQSGRAGRPRTTRPSAAAPTRRSLNGSARSLRRRRLRVPASDPERGRDAAVRRPARRTERCHC